MRFGKIFDDVKVILYPILLGLSFLALLAIPALIGALPALLTFNPLLIAFSILAGVVSGIGLASWASAKISDLLANTAAFLIACVLTPIDATLEFLWNIIPGPVPPALKKSDEPTSKKAQTPAAQLPDEPKHVGAGASTQKTAKPVPPGIYPCLEEFNPERPTMH